MTRARSRYLGAGVFLAATALLLYFSFGSHTAPLPSSWETKYSNLKDSLRALAINPLDPGIIYIGTDQAVLKTADGGATWASVQSFRNNKISVSDVVSEGALELLLEVEGASAASAAGRDARVAEEISPGSSQEGAPEDYSARLAAAAAVTAAASAEIDRARDALALAQAEAYASAAALELMDPEDLTVSEVEAIPEENGFVDEPYFTQLGDWLTERGLALPADGAERIKDLVDYLKKYEEQRQALLRDLATDQAAQAAAEAQSVSAQADYNTALAAQQELEAAPPETEVAIATETEDIGPSTSATPVLDTGYFTGVTYLAIDPSDPDKIFAATFNGTYLSRDGGATWSVLYSGGNTSQAVNLCLAVDPSNPAHIYIGTMVGIALSKDGGTTWDRAPGALSSDVVTALAVHPFDGKIVLAGTRGDGIYLSRDAGGSWERVFTNPAAGAQNIYAVVFSPADPSLVYAATGGGIYRSRDGGLNWETAGGMGLGSSSVRDLVVCPADSNRVILATANGVFGTQDGGSIWRRLTYGLPYRSGVWLDFSPLDPEQIWYLTDNYLFVNRCAAKVDLEKEAGILTGNSEFTFDGKTVHTLFIEDIDEEAGIVKIEIRSVPLKLELATGQEQSVDLDGDGTFDTVIKLESLSEGVPRISLHKTVKVPAVEKSVQLKSADQIGDLEDLEPYFLAEPSCVEVQDAASRWGEVHPEMIADWRWGSRFRALLPKFQIQHTYMAEDSTRTEDYVSASRDFNFYSLTQGYDEHRSSRGDYYSEGFYPSTSLGWPDTYEWYDSYSDFELDKSDQSRMDTHGNRNRDESRVRDEYGSHNNKGWRIQLDWWLGDFLFEREQLYISREARDLVELRQNILEQVTMYYFDRKAARIDMIMNPPADPYSKLESLLRLQQLDASIDALTGSYFTRTIKERRRLYPEVPVY